LLPDREPDTLAKWLQAHPTVQIISRDRAGAYAEGARTGAPDALQIADRFHLMCNLTVALQRILERLVHAVQGIQATDRANPGGDSGAATDVPQFRLLITWQKILRLRSPSTSTTARATTRETEGVV